MAWEKQMGWEKRKRKRYRRPRWLGRLSSCLLKSISRVQLSPSAHTRRDFFLKKNDQRKARERELATFDEIDGQWEC